MCPIFEKGGGGRTPRSHIILMKNTQSDSAYQQLFWFQAHTCKDVEFCNFCQMKDHGCVFIFIFSPGVIVLIQWGLERRDMVHSSFSAL